MYVAMHYFVLTLHVENISHVWNLGFSIPFCHLVGGVEDGLCVARLHEEPNDAIVVYMIFLVLCHTPYGPY